MRRLRPLPTSKCATLPLVKKVKKMQTNKHGATVMHMHTIPKRRWKRG